KQFCASLSERCDNRRTYEVPVPTTMKAAGCFGRRGDRFKCVTVSVCFLAILLIVIHSGNFPTEWTRFKLGGFLFPTPLVCRERPANDTELQRLCLRAKSLPANKSCDVTVVTAYFNLGTLNKMSAMGRYTPKLYEQWMKSFKWINCPLIVFSDSKEVLEMFNQTRAGLPSEKTKLVLLPRQDLWAFKLAPEIKQVYSQPGYPKHQPNTVNENYSCVMHAKFELVNRVIRKDLYDTKYVMWLDIGLFRDLTRQPHNTLFRLVAPADFDEAKVGCSKVHKVGQNLTPRQIVERNLVWVGGATFLGKPDVLYVYTQD
ncbi:hypothetical protein BaRGS_00039520, partial [Batillaria attramentaria]